jgi:1-acyl-sn-glycerol-3-phosphate acyltransferase
MLAIVDHVAAEFPSRYAVGRMSLFGLLRQRRFGPFFWTQFLGAFNDNLFKNALALLVGYRAATRAEGDLLVNLAQGLLVLPFFLFSATAGQLADKYEKSRLVRLIKFAEIGIMTLATIGFLLDDLVVLLCALFLMGTQSAMFGPVKYSLIPQHLREEELVGGNGLIEMGTFLAILLGTIVAGGIMQIESHRVAIVSITVLLLAVAGFLVSRRIPHAEAAAPDLKIRLNPITETWRAIGFAREVRSVFLSILGISWLWFFGALFLAQMLNYARYVLGGDESVVTLLLAAFSIGIASGSILCERLSGGQIEIGLVPLGSIGMTLFTVDLYFASPLGIAAGSHDLVAILYSDFGWRVLTDLVLIGVFGGLFSVPLYALVQHRTEEATRSRVIAANNIMNAGFMVAASLIAIALLRVISIPELFLLTGIANALVAIYIFSLVPEFMMRFLVWMLMHTMYRLEVENIDRIPIDGPAVLVCNHVSYVDSLVISAACRRPIRFVMNYKIFRIPILSFIFRTARAIPIAGRKEDEALMEKAFDDVAQALADGDLVCIFPEGRLTSDGQIATFRRGIDRILERSPVQVVPMALRGLWGSVFSRKRGKALRRWRGMWSRISLHCGVGVAAEEATAAALESRVAALRGDVA